MSRRFIFTSESVTEGHPDKICDRISDSVLDEFLKKDPESRVAVETLTTTGVVIVAGEVTSKYKLDIQDIVRNEINDIGYNKPEYGFDGNTCSVLVSLHEQSPDISIGVSSNDVKEQGAGDQGLMFGFAIDETPQLMPLPITLAHNLSLRLSDVRKTKKLDWVRPDGKSQVSILYEDNKPKTIDAVVLSTQHSPDVSQEQICEEIKKNVIEPVCSDWLNNDTKIFVNPTGRFVIGGPPGDTGLTGRKIIADTYGGMGRHGGEHFRVKILQKLIDQHVIWLGILLKILLLQVWRLNVKFKSLMQLVLQNQFLSWLILLKPAKHRKKRLKKKYKKFLIPLLQG
jgi:S-adenosylmethionine synthetase